MLIGAQPMLKLTGVLSSIIVGNSSLEIHREADGSHSEPTGVKVTAV